MNIQMIFLALLTFTCSKTIFQTWNPDGRRELWCPVQKGCFQMDKINRDYCCACNAVPEWELPQHEGLHSLDVEIMDVKGKTKKLFARNSINKNARYSFIHVNGNLNKFPEDLCKFHIVKIDVTNNRFSEIGNISCFVELDTLIMKNNRITYVSNQTFIGLVKLRSVDLSYNLIQRLDYNLFGDSSIHILKFDFGGNMIHKVDMSNVFTLNKTICRGSYAHNKHHLEITNIGNILGGEHKGTLCGDFDFGDVQISRHPLAQIMDNAGPSNLYKYYPCGQGVLRKSSLVCDCDVGDIINLKLETIRRLFVKELKKCYCEKPKSLAKLTLEDLFINETLQDLLICDLVDNCPKNGNCKCQCTSKPNQKVLIVDCSGQSCTDFPEVVPKTQHDIILNMSYNHIKHVHTRHDYFKKVKVLDLTENPVSVITSDISTLSQASSIVLLNHILEDLPKQVQLLDSNIFLFGKNGIPCNCDNRWIGDWRKYKNVSRQLPLYCSNYKDTLFEDLNNFPACDSHENLYWTFSVIAPVIVGSLLFGLLRYFRYDLIINKRRIISFQTKHTKTWEIDIYVSFDEDNEEIRYFVFLMLEPFLRRKRMTVYIPCRDAWPGNSEEDNITFNMLKCKYFLLLHSSDMHNSRSLHGNARRLEYKRAWYSFISHQINQILILKFDNEDLDYQASKTRALQRCGMVFEVFNRKASVYDKILEVFKDPLVVNSKHYTQRQLRIKAHLWNKNLTSSFK